MHPSTPQEAAGGLCTYPSHIRASCNPKICNETAALACTPELLESPKLQSDCSTGLAFTAALTWAVSSLAAFRKYYARNYADEPFQGRQIRRMNTVSMFSAKRATLGVQVLHAGQRLAVELPEVEDLRTFIRQSEWNEAAKRVCTCATHAHDPPTAQQGMSKSLAHPLTHSACTCTARMTPLTMVLSKWDFD